MHLTTNSVQLARHFNLDAQRSLLFSAIRLDSHPLVAPIIATPDGDPHGATDGATVEATEPVLLVRQQEQGNVLSAGVPRDRIRFYAPWVTLDPEPLEGIDAAGSLPELVAELAAGETVTLSPEFVYTHFLAFSEAADLKLDIKVEALSKVPVVAYKLDTEAILERFAGWRASGIPVAKDLIEGVSHLEGLDQELDATGADTRFAALKDITDRHGLAALFIASPPNFSELTGIEASPEATALWVDEGSSVYLFLPAQSPAPAAGVDAGSFESVGHAVGELIGAGHNIGVEEEFIGTALALSLAGGDAELVPVQMELGNWRDIRDREDLPFQVIAARASVYAIEDALEWANSRLDRGESFKELDIYDRYLDALEEFTRDIPFSVEPYFTNLHSSNRMLFPGPPVDFPIDAETRCIQLDAGVSVKIDGVVVATSDMARSLPRTDASKEAYEFFFEVVRSGIIGQLRPGVVCSDVHEGTLDYLAPHLDRMIEIGMLGADTDFNAIYRRRNVGHLMGKQESFANELRPGYTHVLQEGSFGAAEIPWRFNGVAIGTEDLWYIGRDKTFILSQK